MTEQQLAESFNRRFQKFQGFVRGMDAYRTGSAFQSLPDSPEGDDMRRGWIAANKAEALAGMPDDEDADAGIQWLRDFTPLADVLMGLDFAPVPSGIYDDEEMGREEFTGRMIK